MALSSNGDKRMQQIDLLERHMHTEQGNNGISKNIKFVGQYTKSTN